MAMYAINQEGADSFRKLSRQLDDSLGGIAEADKKLQSSMIAVMEELGIYGPNIWSIKLKVKDIYSSCEDEIRQLSETLNEKATEIEELLCLPGSSSASQLSGAGGCTNAQTLEQISSWLAELNPHY